MRMGGRTGKGFMIPKVAEWEDAYDAGRREKTERRAG